MGKDHRQGQRNKLHLRMQKNSILEFRTKTYTKFYQDYIDSKEKFNKLAVNLKAKNEEMLGRIGRNIMKRL